MTRLALAAVAIGGVIGAVTRWSVGEALPEPSNFPWPTFSVNIGGTLVLGVLFVLIDPLRESRLWLLLATGFCGGLTTFSTLTVETSDLWRDGRTDIAAGYIIVTVVAGVAALGVGMLLGRAVPRWRAR